MRHLVLLLCLGCLVGSMSAAPVPPAARKPPPKLVGPDYEPYMLLGRVESITPTTVIVKPEGNFKIEMNMCLANGVQEERLYVQDNMKPARTFVFSDRMLEHNGALLPPGRRGRAVRPDRGEHKIADLRIGDRVIVDYGTQQGKTLCFKIHILRRPGGRVPDAYGDDDPRYKMKISTERNMRQCVEETLAGKWAPRLAAAIRR